MASGQMMDERSRGLIAIGASTGGTEAVSTILKRMPVWIPGIVVVLHMPAVFTQMYAQRLDREGALKVKEAAEGDRILPGHAYIAPGELQTQVLKRGADYVTHCFSGEKVSGHRPSVDVLFDSVSAFADQNTVGVILTGMGGDGAKGLVKVRKKGALTIGQDQATCVVYGMPMVAKQLGAVTRERPLNRIADEIIAYAGRRR